MTLLMGIPVYVQNFLDLLLKTMTQKFMLLLRVLVVMKTTGLIC
jgi:hypothetical protein